MSGPVSRAATRKRRRLYILLAALTMVGIAVALVLTAFEDSVVFFYSPSDLQSRQMEPGRRLRLGGLVAEGSVRPQPDGISTRFTVTDMKHSVDVVYTGLLPDLFREGQGVVVEGSFLPEGGFRAAEVLAKHDETYMPPEVADALKRAGRWKHAEEPPGGTGR
ncbi:MAG: cytochrome c maturation protein CcmE [Alphaproteobacteria bacterium]